MNTVKVENCKTLFIGRRGENEVTEVVFDFTEWQEQFGTGVIDLYVKRNLDIDAYPVVLSVDGTIATWLVTAADTDVVGNGKIEYVYTVNEKIAKSAVFQFFVGDDIGESSPEPPEHYQSWLEQLTELGAETQANAQAAAQSASEAAESASEAAESASEAAESAAQVAEDSNNAEAWAVGERNGEPVSEGDPTYDNNAKYWAENARANAPVQSVNGEDGYVVLTLDDIPNGETYVRTTPEQLAQIATNSDDIADVKATADTALQPDDLRPYRTAAAQDAIDQSQNTMIGIAIQGKQAKITASGILKGDGAGGVSSAVAGVDYLESAPVTSVNGQTGDVTIQAATDAQVTTAVNTWLGENVSQETGYVLDASLTMSNAAPPASAVGELKSAINQKADYYYQTATGSNLEILNAIPETDVQSLVVTTAYTQTGSGSPSLTNVRPITCVTELTLSQKGSATGTAVDHTFDLDESTPVGVGDLSYNGDGTWTLTGKYVLVSVDYGFFSSASDIVFPSSGTTFYIKNAFYYAGNGVSYKNRSIIKGGYFCVSNAFDVVTLNNSSYNASQRRLYLSNSGGWTTKDAFLQSVQDYYNNGGTVQFLYDSTDEIPETTYTSEELNKLTGTDYFTTNNGEISITYKIDLLKEINEANDHIDSVDEVNSFPKEDVLTANDDAVNKIRASRWLRSSTASPLSLLWFSDPHRHTSSLKRIVKFKEYLKANSLIEESICTGDLVHGSINEGNYYEKFWYGTEGTEDILIAVGNHEHYENSVSPHGKASLSTIDGVMFKDIANWGVEREDYNTFYYKDYPEQSIRLIVADPAIVTSVDGVDEEAWLDTTLSGARTLGYSVVIASHYLKLDESTETKSVTIYDNGWSNNLARATATSTMGYDWSNSCDIVKCVTEFIADGGSFLCYLIGHTHTDIVSYPTGHQDQLIISLASASSERDHATKLTTNDLPRYDSTKTQDCFNVITFDATNKIIKCVRVGANMNMYEQPRTAFAYDVQNHTFLSVI